MKIILKFLLLVLLMMWPVYAQSQEPPPRPFKDIQIQNTRAGEDKNKSDSSQQMATKSLTIVKPFPANPRDMQSQNKEENTFKESFYDKLIGWSTVVLAIVTTILAFYTYRLWSATKETAQRQLRAYVFATLAEGEKLSINNNGCLTAPLVIKNYGQTPAYELKCSVFIGFYKLPLSVILDPPNYANGSIGYIAPNQISTIHPTLPSKLHQSEVDAIKTGGGGIYVWGYLEYVDTFKIYRKTQFRMLSAGDAFAKGELACCKEGNEAT